MTRPDLRPVATPAEGPGCTFADQVRDALALRDRRMEERYPAALALEARVLAAMHQELHGCAAAVAGVDAPEHFREALRGERAARLGRHLCRLVLSPRPEAQRAVDAALRILAEARGYQLEPLPSAIATLVESTVRLAKETLDVQTELTRALEGDGQPDAEQLDRLERENADVVRAAAQHHASIAAARRRL